MFSPYDVDVPQVFAKRAHTHRRFWFGLAVTNVTNQ